MNQFVTKTLSEENYWKIMSAIGAIGEKAFAMPIVDLAKLINEEHDLPVDYEDMTIAFAMCIERRNVIPAEVLDEHVRAGIPHGAAAGCLSAYDFTDYINQHGERHRNLFVTEDRVRRILDEMTASGGAKKVHMDPAPIDLAKLIELGAEQARETYRLFPDQEQMPACVYGVKGGEVTNFHKLRMVDDTTRMLGRAAAAKMLKDEGCEASIFVAEVWVTRNQKKEEGVIVFASSPEICGAAFFAIKRNKKGRVAKLVKRDGEGSGDTAWDFFADERGQRHTAH